jgi:hypothetical protein
MDADSNDARISIVLTQWALDSYLDLKHLKVFSPADYKEAIRPDVKLLESYPAHPKFANGKFWSPATLDNNALPNGYKMKWHNLGVQRVQLRLTVGLGFDKELSDTALLCHAYVKNNPKTEYRQLLKFKTRLELIRRREYTERGRLA